MRHPVCIVTVVGDTKEESWSRPVYHQCELLRLWFLLAVAVVVFTPRLHAQGQVTTLPGPFHFDGTNYVTLGNSAALAPTSQITISGWIKPDFSVQNVMDTILNKRDGCGFYRSYQLAVWKTYQNFTPGTILFSPDNANIGDLNSTVPVPNDGRFHHVAGTYDGTTEKVFLDGVLVGQLSHAGPIPTTSDPAVIGIQAGCGDLAYAEIGQVRIYNYAVPESQIMSETPGFALLDGGNSFVGNQQVTGVVTASSFIGDGSGLSNIGPANIASGTAGINISGTAASAVTATDATNAGNALNLGGIAAVNYARRDIGNSFNGNQGVTGDFSVSGNARIGGSTMIGFGTPIVKHISTLSPNVAFNAKLGPTTCLVWPSSASAVDGDTVIGTLSGSLMSANIVHSAYVLNGFVQVRICNPTGSPTQIGAGSIRVDVWKH
jgi:hypothetical protein